MKIATWNVNSVRSRLEHLKEFLRAQKPDILLLQELKCETEKFPLEELSDFPYNFYVHGQKSYNGVAVLSKYRADEVKYDFDYNPVSEQARFIEFACQTEIGYCRIICLYAPNGGEVASDKFQSKLEFYDALTNYLNSIKTNDEKLLIGGDFNIAPFNIDVHDPAELANSTCFTLEERQKFRIILNNGFEDAYRYFNPDSREFSWWDYRKGAFEKNEGMRIDGFLVSDSAIASFKKCYIDYDLRTAPRPSDHAAVIMTTA